MADPLAPRDRPPTPVRPPGRAPRRRAVVLGLTLVSALAAPPLSAPWAGPSPDPTRRPGGPGMLEPHTGSLLVDYYETFLRDHDVDEFRRHVSARYMEGTLARLVEAPDPRARRAAVLALGLIGSFEVNAAVARALRDGDATVRSLADNALWAIWFRADTPENNAALERVSGLISRQRYEEAVDQATRLIGRAPGFAEAYNQRAIAHYSLGQFRESAEDCRQALARNPYHTGALAGLAKCHLRLGERPRAIEALKRAARLQPYNHDLAEWLAVLENEAP